MMILNFLWVKLQSKINHENSQHLFNLNKQNKNKKQKQKQAASSSGTTKKEREVALRNITSRYKESKHQFACRTQPKEARLEAESVLVALLEGEGKERGKWRNIPVW